VEEVQAGLERWLTHFLQTFDFEGSGLALRA